MIDIVIPLGNGSKHNNLELDYCIKGIKKHVHGSGDIYIVGNTPNRDDIIHIPHAESSKPVFKERNICDKLLHACALPEVSETFLYMNDDHFLLRDVLAYHFPFHHKGILPNVNGDNVYYRSLKNTHRALSGKGYNTNNFDVHCPILIEKKAFICAMAQYDWSASYGYVVKSLYANTVGLKGSFVKDVKINKAYTEGEIQAKIEGQMYFSVGDAGLNEAMKNVLNELYG